MKGIFYLIFNFQLLEFLKGKFEEKEAQNLREYMNKGTLGSLTEIGDSLISLNKEKPIFKLKEIIKFKNTKQKLRAHPLYELYSLVTQNFNNAEKNERYNKFLNHSLRKLKNDSQSQNPPKRARNAPKSTRSKEKGLSSKELNKLFFRKQPSIEFDLPPEEDPNKMREDLENKQFKTRVFDKIEEEGKSKFAKFHLEVPSKWMLAMILTVVDHFQAFPHIYKEFVQNGKI
jgi:hypothetical protein